MSKSDAGSYKCRAENGLEPSVESDFVLQVSGTEWGKFVFWACFTRHWVQYLALSRNEALLGSDIDSSVSLQLERIGAMEKDLLSVLVCFFVVDLVYSCEYDLFPAKITEVFV